MNNAFSWSWAEDPEDFHKSSGSTSNNLLSIQSPQGQMLFEVSKQTPPLLMSKPLVFDIDFFQFKLPEDCLELDFHSFWSILFNLHNTSLISEWFSFIAQHPTFNFQSTSSLISEQFHDALESGSFLGSRHVLISQFFQFFPIQTSDQRQFNGNSFALSLFQSLNDFDVQYHREDFFYPALYTLMQCGVPPDLRNSYGESPLSKLNQLLGQIRLTLPNPSLEKDLFQCAQLIIELTHGDPDQFRILPPIERIVDHSDLLNFYHAFKDQQNLLSTLRMPSSSTSITPSEPTSSEKKTKRL